MMDLTDRTQPVWIGGTDRLIEGHWTWDNSTNPEPLITKFYWGSNQPNNYNNQDCLAYYKLAGVYSWADEHCNTKYPFICEK
ncbi:lectin BRA-3-like [Mytilus galloprovincialis]|uniref:lectin BRA-3-like n=1 Tax=Mytilus galloprovincialis TaxID=29158 RepID=UPI003F7BD873